MGYFLDRRAHYGTPPMRKVYGRSVSQEDSRDSDLPSIRDSSREGSLPEMRQQDPVLATGPLLTLRAIQAYQLRVCKTCSSFVIPFFGCLICGYTTTTRPKISAKLFDTTITLIASKPLESLIPSPNWYILNYTLRLSISCSAIGFNNSNALVWLQRQLNLPQFGILLNSSFPPFSNSSITLISTLR